MFWCELDLRCHSTRWWALCQYTPIHFQVWWLLDLLIQLPSGFTSVSHRSVRVATTGQWRCFLHRWRLVAKWWHLHSMVTWQMVCQTHTSGLVALRQVQEGHSKDLDPPFSLILNYCFTHDRPRPHQKITLITYQQRMSGSAKLAQGESEVDNIMKKKVFTAELLKNKIKRRKKGQNKTK